MIAISSVAQSMTSSAIREILKITQRPEVISFAGGLPAPELFPVEEIRAATDKVLTEQPAAALQYSTTEGHLPLRAWIAEQNGIAPDQVQITSGSQQGLDLLGRVLIDPGDVILVESPTYLGALQAFSPYRPRFVELITDDDGIVPEALDDQLRTLSAKLLYTVPTFQNPTGRTLSAERRRALLEVTRRHGVTILEDGPYNELRFRGERLPTLFELALADANGLNGEGADESNVIMLGTFSKVLAPGLRDAWVQGPRPVIDKLVLAKQAADLHSPTLNQMIITELLDDVLPRQIKIISEEYGRRARVMIDQVGAQLPAGVRCTDPDGGMFCWVTLPDAASVDTTAMLAEAVEHRVAYVPGQPFFASGEGSNTLRLSYVTSSEEEIATGVAALAEVIAGRLARLAAATLSDMTRQPSPAGSDRVPDDLDELLRNASHRMRHRWAAVLQPWELSPHHARALRAIVSSEPLRLTELADRLRVANRSVTDVVDALVERGLAVRGAVPGDRRATAVRATDAGRELLDNTEHARRTDLTDFFGKLTDPERRQLAALLRKLIDD